MVVSSTEEVHGPYVPADVPTAARATSATLSCLSLAIVSVCIIRRIQNVKSWRTLSIPAWILIALYFDSFLFVSVSAIVKGIGSNTSKGICEASILICICFYFSSKVLLYYFLVEKVHIVRREIRTRLQDKLYIFNCFGMMLPYLGVVILSFIWRIGYINTDGTCIIGIGRQALIPVVAFDIIVNAYLTALFIAPIRRLYSYKSKSRARAYLHSIAWRSFTGSCCTLLATIANGVTMMVLNGEPGWLCFVSCNADVLFAVLVLHWVSKSDHNQESSYKLSEDDATPSGSKRLKLRPSKISATIQSNCEATHGQRWEERETDKTRITVEQVIKVEVDRRSERIERMGSEDEIQASSESWRKPQDSAV
ncbi:hypothetical protein B0J12DRAFT_666031 [Macrophomina phaseolina]|uniref:Uncharacterized protein n=1 Tax=Macrophomina phaseolina TaxID=35725 RepID=A0ABQ8G8X1_9PEZI|nr:hypothetical protein B0J12DRAFT_666031 [Macrophomina phaseolina]